MSPPNLVRWSALAAMAGGVLFAGAITLTNFVESHTAFHVIDAPPYILLTAGLVGLYVRQAGYFGWLGKAGFYLTMAGFAMVVLLGLTVIIVESGGGQGGLPAWLGSDVHDLTPLLLVIVGSIFFGAATLRAGVLPRGGALLLILGPLAYLVVGFGGIENVWLLTVPGYLFGVGWVWLGYVLWSERAGAVRQAQDVS